MSFAYHHIEKWAMANLDLVEESLEKNKKAVVLISGASSSGKSYCADLLKGLLEKNGHPAAIISLDQYNIGLSRIIPNKVNLKDFDNGIEHIRKIENRIHDVIVNVPFDEKYDFPVLDKLREVLKDDFTPADLEKFLKGLYREWKILNFDEPTVYDLKEAALDIKRLLNNETVPLKNYSKVVSERVKSEKSLNGNDFDTIIVEGIYALNDELLSELKNVDTIKDFIDGNPKSLFLRRIIRDAKSTSASNVFTISAYFNYIVPSYQETISPCRDVADVILSNDMTFSEMRAGDLYTVKRELHSSSHEIASFLKREGQISEVSYQKDTYFSVLGENPDSNNILRLRSVSTDNGKTYFPSSLVHKGIPKVRKDHKVIRPVNVFLKEGEFDKVWKNETSCIQDFLMAGFLIGPIQHKIKTRLVYKGQKITIREVERNGVFIEFADPVDVKVFAEIRRKIIEGS